jgi:hypothetical protein
MGIAENRCPIAIYQLQQEGQTDQSQKHGAAAADTAIKETYKMPLALNYAVAAADDDAGGSRDRTMAKHSI